MNINRIGEPFNATFGLSTVHKTTWALIPSSDGMEHPLKRIYTLCGIEISYEIVMTQKPVTCKRCLKK